MIYLLLILLAILPTALLVFFICKKGYRLDSKKYMWQLLLIGGVIALIAIGLFDIEELIIPLLDSTRSEDKTIYGWFYNFFGAAFNEELLKWAACLIFVYRSKHYKQTLDGVVYCTLISLGFAGLENLCYVFEGEISTLVARALLAVPGHFCYGVLMGYYFSRSKQASIQKAPGVKKNLLIGFLIPYLLHASYDYGRPTDHVLFLMWLYLAFVVIMFVNTFKLVKKAATENEDLPCSVPTAEIN